MTHSYEINKNNILTHEIIGLRARVIKSTDKNKEGIEGRIIDERENVINIEMSGSVRIVPKSEVFIEIELPSKQRLIVDGHLLKGRPEDRIKSAWRKYYAH